MVFTGSKLKEPSKEELTEELLSFDDLSDKINDLIKKKDDLATKFYRVFLSCRFLKPAIHYYANELLIWSDHPWIMLNIWEEKLTEINPVALEVSNNELEGQVYKALSLTGNEVSPDDLEVCHRLKKKENVIIKFKSRKLIAGK